MKKEFTVKLDSNMVDILLEFGKSNKIEKLVENALAQYANELNTNSAIKEIKKLIEELPNEVAKRNALERLEVISSSCEAINEMRGELVRYSKLKGKLRRI